MTKFTRIAKAVMIGAATLAVGSCSVVPIGVKDAVGRPSISPPTS